MALIELTLEGKIDKVKKAISRIQAYAFDVPVAAISGGKDSVVLDALCQMAGIKYEPIYNVTSVDPPELVRFIKYKIYRQYQTNESCKMIPMLSTRRQQKIDCACPNPYIRV